MTPDALPRHLARVHVDYNTLYGGLVRASSPDRLGLGIGEVVTTFDEDGNEAQGVVEVVHPGGKVVRIRLNMATWKDGPA